MTRTMTIFFSLLAPGLALADGVDLAPYERVDSMGENLSTASDLFDGIIHRAAEGKERSDEAQERADEAYKKYGPDTYDTLIEQERARSIRVETLGEIARSTLSELPALEEQASENRGIAGAMLKDGDRFEALVRDYLSGETGPESTAITVYVATEKLYHDAFEVFALAEVHQQFAELDRLASAVEVLDGLVDSDTASMPLEQAIDTLFPEESGGFGEGGPVDDLDLVLEGR